MKLGRVFDNNADCETQSGYPAMSRDQFVEVVSGILDPSEYNREELKKEYIDFLNDTRHLFGKKLLPKTPKEKRDWYDEIRLLVERDQYTLDEIKSAITFAREDDFWKANFLSVLKLRRKNPEKIKYIEVFLEKIKAGTRTKYPEGHILNQNDGKQRDY